MSFISIHPRASESSSCLLEVMSFRFSKTIMLVLFKRSELVIHPRWFTCYFL
nr:MAG TPA: hypothetical protein [Caudoviricetes sp.]